MDPHIYPDPQLAPITLPAAPATGAPAPTFTPIEQLAAPDPSTPFIAKTMFIRVAMSGAPCGSVIAPTAPNFYLKADTGDAVLINDHTKLPDQTYSIYHRPGTDPRDFVADGKVDLESNNVFRITVVFQDPAGTYTWQFGIWNNDTGASRQFTWVLSATLANTAQPWIDVEPTILSWDVLVNNKGTAPFTVNSVSPALPAGFALGPLPVSLNPGTSAPLTVTFTGSGKPSGTKGSVTATANVTITPADGTAGTSAGHSRQLSVSATDDTTVRSLTLKRDGVDPKMWPGLSCSQANEASLKDSSLRLDPNREVIFQGNGSMRSSGDMRFLTGTPDPTEKVRVLANGNVGIGTNNPTVSLDIAQNTAIRLGNAYVSSGGPEYAHFSSNAWYDGTFWQIPDPQRKSGLLQFADNNILVYFTQTPGGIDWTQRITIGSDGKLGIFYPNDPIDLAHAAFVIENPSGSQSMQYFSFQGVQKASIRADSNGNLVLNATSGQIYWNRDFGGPTRFNPAGGTLDVAFAVHASDFSTSSDERFKTNVVPLTDVLGKLDSIRGIVFDWNELYGSLGRSTGRREIGVIAQDVEKVFPELVSAWDEQGYKAVDYGRLTGVLVEAIKELKAKNESLERRLEALEKLLGAAPNNGTRDEPPPGRMADHDGNAE